MAERPRRIVSSLNVLWMLRREPGCNTCSWPRHRWCTEPGPTTRFHLPSPLSYGQTPSFASALFVARSKRSANSGQPETGGALTIVRPATTLARGRENGLALLLRNSAALRNRDGDAPAQFLHAEDFAAAVELLVAERHAGVFNVAPDGWLRVAEVNALRGVPETPLRVPAPVITAVSDARRRLGAATHPGLTPYLQHPWVIANDKLKALGWEPEFSNEEAYVAGYQPSRFDGVDAKRRQELALGAAGAAIAAGAVGVAGAISWVVRRGSGTR